MAHPTHPMPGAGGCGCGHLLCEWCGNPATPTFWIMELLTGDPPTWRGIHPSQGNVYRYDSKDQAAHMLSICYPDQLRDARLGDEPVVRVTLCCELDGGLFRVADGTEVL